jgi:hypothetical protein
LNVAAKSQSRLYSFNSGRMVFLWFQSNPSSPGGRTEKVL